MPDTLLGPPPVAAPPLGARTHDEVLPATRAGTVLLFALAIANGVFLYLVPAQAEAHYAWAIAPPVSAAVMGAGYLAGCVGTCLAAFVAERFRSFRAVLPGFILLSLTMLAATIAHADRFRWDYAPTIVWTAVYAGIPIGVGVLWWLQARRDVSQVSPDRRLRPVAVASGIAAVVLGAVGAMLVTAPSFALERWPWELTELLSRVFGGWYLFSAATLAFVSVSARRLEEVPIPYATVATWSALLLPLPALYSASVQWDATLAAYLALHALLAVACASAALTAWRRIRADRTTL